MGVAIEMTTFEKPMPGAMKQSLKPIQNRTVGCCDVFEKHKTTARPENSKHLFNHLSRLIYRAQHKCSNNYFYAIIRQIHRFSLDPADIYSDSISPGIFAQIIVHCGIGFDRHKSCSGPVIT